MRIFHRTISILLLLAMFFSYAGSVYAGEENDMHNDEYSVPAPEIAEEPDVAAPDDAEAPEDDVPDPKDSGLTSAEDSADDIRQESEETPVPAIIEGISEPETTEASVDPEPDGSNNISSIEPDEAGAAADATGEVGENGEPSAEAEDEETDPERVLRTITIEPEQPELFDEYDNPLEMLDNPEQLWYWLFGREAKPAQTLPSKRGQLPGEPIPEPVPEPGAVRLTISGYFPEDVTAQASAVLFDEPDVYSESALFALDLKLLDGSGEIYVPDEGDRIKVTVDGYMVNDAVYHDKPVLVDD